MAESTKEKIEIYVDLSKLNDAAADISEAMFDLKGVLLQIKASITLGFGTVKEQLGSVNTGITTLTESVVSALDEIMAEVERTAFEEAAELGSNITGIVSDITDIGSKVKNALSGKGNGNQTSEQQSQRTFDDAPSNAPSNAPRSEPTNAKGQLLLPAPGESSYGKTSGDDGSSLGLVSGGLMDLGSSLPSPESLVEMATCIGDVAIKLKESAVAWGQELAAKVASRAEDLKIIAVNTVEHAKAFGIMIGQLVASAAAWAAETAAKVANTAAQWAQIAATTAWQAICVAATAVTAAFGAAVNFLTSPIGLVVVAITALIAIVVLLVKNWDTVKAAALSVWETIKGAFGKAGEWFKTTLLDPLSNGFKNMANGIIGFINGLITGAVKGINGLIALLNKLQFTVPDWVPGLGGKSLGFHIKTISAPQIPYLAKGAVLPANKPFLAVVGDQRHGTNVEAPLATIQEAVALVMDDHISAMLAGFEALLQEQRAIRQTVEGIQIGDSVIGRAAQRYNRKMAVVTGGY